jgi:hypothetical protein
MIPFEKQVCSLEPSQKLNELGVKQESVWEWRKYSLRNDYTLVLVGHLPEDGELAV